MFPFLLLLTVFTFTSFSNYIPLPYTYLDTHGNLVPQYESTYDPKTKTPRKNVIVYSCEKAAQALNTSSPSRPSFRPDPRLPRDETAVDDDYRNSGLTRGHLVTAKYFAYILDAYHNTFYFTNVAPQYSSANELWAVKDEMIMLGWMAENVNCRNDMVVEIAVSGDSGTIGEDKVVIPDNYLAAFCEPVTGNSICFWEDNVDDCKEVHIGKSVKECDGIMESEGVPFFSGKEIVDRFPLCQKFAAKDIDYSFWGISNRTRIF